MPAAIDRPRSLDDALGRLTGDARPIAGGVAVMLAGALGQVEDRRWVAVGHLPELRGTRLDPSTGELTVGAATTLAELATSEAARAHAPLLARAAAAAASPGIRSIATVGGNVLGAPAGSDLVAALLALDALLVVRSSAGGRVAGGDAVATGRRGLDAGELLVAVRVPSAPGSGWSLQRLQTQGRADRPAVTVALRLDAAGGRVTTVRAAATFVADRAIGLDELGPAVAGASPGAIAAGEHAAAIEGAARATVDRAIGAGAVFVDDTRASAAYRRDMVGVLAARAVAEAAARVAR